MQVSETQVYTQEKYTDQKFFFANKLIGHFKKNVVPLEYSRGKFNSVVNFFHDTFVHRNNMSLPVLVEHNFIKNGQEKTYKMQHLLFVTLI